MIEINSQTSVEEFIKINNATETTENEFAASAEQNQMQEDSAEGDDAFIPLSTSTVALQGMKEILKRQVLDKDHSNHDSFILVILSHGEKGVVFGIDGRLDEKSQKPEDCLQVLEIRKEVCRVPSLLNKPKLIFIQACRGKERDEGLSLNSGKKRESDGDVGGQDAFSGGGESSNDPADSRGNQDVAEPNVTPAVLPRPGEETEQGPLSSEVDFKARKKPISPPTKSEDELDTSAETVPSLADSFLAMSTTEGEEKSDFRFVLIHQGTFHFKSKNIFRNNKNWKYIQTGQIN
ncbi:caspase-3 [Plakobranchus ocellatus]|uniref:Caspase-3 n=1 Tax=Plakobranchus ocellatus TaxID=259542 RepID=A0AAV4C4U1_9GAST|nr:caspase-3 [Plakobranchus ocellatus]